MTADKKGLTAMHFAAIYGQSEILCYLLLLEGDAKAIIDSHTKDKKTALIFAAGRGHY